MMFSVARQPWGRLHWLIDRLECEKWSTITCCGTEERSTTTWETTRSLHRVDSGLVAVINDPPSRYSPAIDALLQTRKGQFLAAGGSPTFRNYDLLTGTDNFLADVDEFLDAGNADILFDISALPKRFFFLCVKILMADVRVRNLVITCTIPLSYPEPIMADDAETWRPLPGFSDMDLDGAPIQLAFVGVGFMSLGLPDLLKDFDRVKRLKMLIPFPSRSDQSRNWLFIDKVQKSIHGDAFDSIRMDPLDVPEAFSYFLRQTQGGTHRSLFAPFGPKAISLAMAIFASAIHMNNLPSSPVYYTQPRLYHPRYSEGVSFVDGLPEVYCYAIKLGGELLYRL